MRIAALYDIHGNLPALEAVLAEVELIGPDAIVVGGDVALGAMPAQTIDRLRALDERARFVMGNTDRDLVEAFDAGGDADEGGDEWERLLALGAEQIDRSQRDFLAGFEPTVALEGDGLGPVLFCHGSPRSDEEIITALTPPGRLGPMLQGVAEPIVVCGHTHHQFVLEHDGRRVVNAGAVGMPYQGVAAAFWLLLGRDVELRRTDYDVDAAIDTMRAAGAPALDEAMLRESLVEPTEAETVAHFFEDRAARP
jgi:predicted phosphodiesterase